MQCAGTRLCDDGDHATAIVAILRVKIVGQHPEFGDGIEIRDDESTAVHQLFHVAPVHDEAIGVFTLAADGLVACV